MKRTHLQRTMNVATFALLLAAGTGCGGNQEPDDLGLTDMVETDVPRSDAREDSADQDVPDVPDGPPRLHADGMKIVDPDGNEVLLKGVNLGGYLYHETWLTLVDYSLQARAYAVAEELDIVEQVRPILVSIGPQLVTGIVFAEDELGRKVSEEAWMAKLTDGVNTALDQGAATAFLDALASRLPGVYDDSDLPLYKKLEERFDPEVRDQLLDAYQEAWIQEKDIQWLSEQGFNLVRVPIGYRSLVTGSHLAQPSELNWNEAAFTRIENLLNWCEKWGVYAVIDIQECPGGQNDYSGESLLYSSEFFQGLTVQLWEELSSRLSGRDVVAAYSLLAEPMSAPSPKARDDMYDKLVKAIRAKGDNHLLVIHDGFKSVDSLPDPSKYDWENVVYSTHIFEWNAESFEDLKSIVDLYDLYYRVSQERQNVPYFIGSFSGRVDQPWAYQGVEYMLDWFDRYSWSWSIWTYKHVQDPIAADLWGDAAGWGLKSRLAAPFDRPDVFRDDQSTLMTKFGSYADMELEVNQTLLDILKADWAAVP